MKTILAIVALVLLSGAAWGQIKADDPTAWKQTDSEVKALVEPKLTKTIELKIWGDSRYRLEKNEVTGRLAISENRQGKWVQIESDWKAWIWPKNRLQNERLEPIGVETFTEQEMIERLERLRKQEREDKAWRPIK